MTDPLRPPTPRPELLAAYIDGELDPATAARVEAWLLTDPHACELLDEQYLLSPSHREFWRAVSPPEPSTARWNHSAPPDRQTPPAAAGFPRSTLALPPHPTAYAGSPLVVHHQR
jgi:anti-sigma factor RsiW